MAPPLPASFFQRSYSFWAGLLGGCFLTCASHGTEQLLVQRLLSARNEQDSRRGRKVGSRWDTPKDAEHADKYGSNGNVTVRKVQNTYCAGNQ